MSKKEKDNEATVRISNGSAVYLFLLAALGSHEEVQYYISSDLWVEIPVRDLGGVLEKYSRFLQGAREELRRYASETDRD